MEIIALVIFETREPPRDLYFIPRRRLYHLERDGDILIWTLYKGEWAPQGQALPVLFRDASCIGADLIYDQVEFEQACKTLEGVTP